MKRLMFIVVILLLSTQRLSGTRLPDGELSNDWVYANWSLIKAADNGYDTGKLTKDSARKRIERRTYYLLEIEFEWPRIEREIDSMDSVISDGKKKGTFFPINDVLYENLIRLKYNISPHPYAVCGDLHLYYTEMALRLLYKKYGGLSERIRGILKRNGWEWKDEKLLKYPPPDSLYTGIDSTEHFKVFYKSEIVDSGYVNTVAMTLEEKHSAVENLIGGKIDFNIRGRIKVYIDYPSHIWVGDSNAIGVTVVYLDTANRRMNAFIVIKPGLSDGVLKGIAVHEYSHYVQHFGGGRYNDESLFLEEATSVWTQFELTEETLYDSVKFHGRYIKRLHFRNNVMAPIASLWSMNSIIKSPQQNLFKPVWSDGYYSRWLFLNYIKEHYGIEKIREIWKRCWKKRGVNDIKATVKALGGEKKFKRVYQNFMIANYFKDYKTIDKKLWPIYLEYPKYVFNHPQFRSDNIHIWQSIKPLGTKYIMEFGVPRYVKDSTHVYLRFNDGKEPNKFTKDSRYVIVVNNLSGRDTIYIDHPEGEKYFKLSIYGILHLMFNNVSLKQSSKEIDSLPFFELLVVPTINSYTLSRPTYTSGDTIEIEVEISDTVFWNGESLVRADFTSIDNNFTDSKVEYLPVSGNERKVKIRYIIPDSARSGEYEIPIKAYDRAVILEHLGNHIPNEVKVNIRIDNLPRIKKTKTDEKYKK